MLQKHLKRHYFYIECFFRKLGNEIFPLKKWQQICAQTYRKTNCENKMNAAFHKGKYICRHITCLGRIPTEWKTV